MTLVNITTFLLWGVLTLYILLGGLSFGITIWTILTPSKQTDMEQRFLQEAFGPFWECAHALFVLFIVGLFMAFPDAFTALITALFWPFLLMLLGILLRLVALMFRSRLLRASSLSKAVYPLFAGFSLITPFLLGVSIGVIGNGQIYIQQNAHAVINFWTGWTAPYAIAFGAIAIALCATIAAAFLVVRAEDADDVELTAAYRWRALIATGVTMLLCIAGLLLSPSDAPVLWHGMLTATVVMALITAVFGILTILSLVQKPYRHVRILTIVSVVCFLGTWSLALRPYLVPPVMSIESVSATNQVLQSLLIAAVIVAGSVLLPLGVIFSRRRR